MGVPRYADSSSPPPNDHPRTSSAGFDAEALERRYICFSKKAFEIFKEQEKTKQAQFEMEKQQAQVKSQMARYQDETEHEQQRTRNQELVRMQEGQETARRATTDQIQPNYRSLPFINF